MLTKIIPGGFKQLNSTLTKPDSRQDQAPGTLKDCLSSHEDPNQNEVQSISKSFPVNYGVRKLWRGFCKLYKNHWGQSLGHGPHQTWGSLLTQTRVSSQTQNWDLNPNANFIIKEMEGHVQRLDTTLALLINASLSSSAFCIKCEPVSSAFPLRRDPEKHVSSTSNNRVRSASNGRPAFLL